MAGKVWLVGAGPSDLGLLTLRGKAVLEQAEVVVYDALVGAEILALLPKDAEKINVGKRANHHLKTQEEINALLLEKVQEGKRVVRLKGGDPFLFGRGGEELELLAKHGVPYEVVPGVTSAIAVPAYAGIPVTHRDHCSSVHIVTGHKKRNEPLNLPFRALAETGGTLVFLMGVSALQDICTGLLSAGMDPETPAAFIEKGTTSEQRTVTADLSTLPQKAAEATVGTPAVIVVGSVCGLRDSFAWREKLPLFGCRVLVTRPRERAGTLSDKLRKLGAEVIEVPAIETVPIAPNAALEGAISELDAYQWLVFTSPRGVELFFDQLRAQKKDLRVLGNCRFAVIGSGTAAALEQRGLFADLMPEIYDVPHLSETLRDVVQPGERVLIPRASGGDPELISALRQTDGAEITEIPLYDTVYAPSEVLDLAVDFEAHPQTLAVFTSASTVRGFMAAARGLDGSRVTALCIGAQTAAQAEAFGMRTHVAKQATIDALIELVQEVYKGANV